MVSSLGNIEWKRFEIAVPAFFTIIAMPLSYSIATGIAIGFIFYPITMIVSGRRKEVHPIMYGLWVIFVLYFIFIISNRRVPCNRGTVSFIDDLIKGGRFIYGNDCYSRLLSIVIVIHGLIINLI